MSEKRLQGNHRPDLSSLVQTASPIRVLQETRKVLATCYPGRDFPRLKRAFHDTVSLYRGKFPGYRACNTRYHDLRHVTDVLLALLRLLDGLRIAGRIIGADKAELALISTLLHDTGYIQHDGDTRGTGAKYASVHVERSAEFSRKYLQGSGFTLVERELCSRLIAATSINRRIVTDGPEQEDDLLAAAVFCADLLGQMADRLYLEKLLYLYEEFQESDYGGYGSEEDLLERTLLFFETFRRRLKSLMPESGRFMRLHFRHRWDIDRDLYSEAIQGNIHYLKSVLGNRRRDYRSLLRRGGVVNELGHAFAT